IDITAIDLAATSVATLALPLFPSLRSLSLTRLSPPYSSCCICSLPVAAPSRLLLQHPAAEAVKRQPRGASGRPAVRMRLITGQSQPVAAALVDVQVERHAVMAERRRELQGILDRHGRILRRMPDERRRRVRRDARFVAQRLDHVRVRLAAE